MLHVRGLDHGSQPYVSLLARTGRASLPCMKATSRHTQRAAQRTHRVVFLLRLDPGVPRAGVLAKYASAFFRISSSCSARANAWRSRINSACSSRSEEHTYELQSLMRTSYAVFCLQKKT